MKDLTYRDIPNLRTARCCASCEHFVDNRSGTPIPMPNRCTLHQADGVDNENVCSQWCDSYGPREKRQFPLVEEPPR